MHSSKLLSLLFISLFVFTVHAQKQNDINSLSLENGTIDNQFEYVIRKSNRYQEFKVVRTTWLYKLKAHTLDSLKAIKKDLSDSQALIELQMGEISNLKNNLTKTQNDLNKTVQEKDSMSLFGLQLSKTNYNLLMWAVIAGLIVLLILFVFKFKNSNSITKTAKNNLSELEEEFEEHRRNSIEREQKVRRQLQDELNKQKGTS